MRWVVVAALLGCRTPASDTPARPRPERCCCEHVVSAGEPDGSGSDTWIETQTRTITTRARCEAGSASCVAPERCE